MMADTVPVTDPGDDGTPLTAGASSLPRSSWSEASAMLPDVMRLLRALAVDPRVPRRSKVLAGLATAYVALPIGRVPDIVPGTGIGYDDVVALVWAVRHLIAAAGFDVVRDLWTGTDAAFAMLVVMSGMDH